jgi:hypothetical protein
MAILDFRFWIAGNLSHTIRFIYRAKTPSRKVWKSNLGFQKLRSDLGVFTPLREIVLFRSGFLSRQVAKFNKLDEENPIY